MKDSITKLNDVFQYVYHNPHSDFYYKRFAPVVGQHEHITSLADWEQLPFTTKADLQATSVFERTFVPVPDCQILRTSSGTSGSKPIFTLRNQIYYYDAIFDVVPPKGVFMVTSYLCAPVETFWRYDPDMVFIGCDMDRLEEGVQMLVGTPVNYLDMWVHAYELVIPLLQKYNLIDQIEVLAYYGEKMPLAQYRKLKEVFPRAHIYETFSCSEVHDSNNFAAVDGDYDETYGPILQTGHNIYPEVVDVETQEIIKEPYRVGELASTLLHTTGTPWPAVRFKTGDLVMYTEYHEDFWRRKLVVRGRKDLSTIRILGGQLQVEEFQRVLASFDDRIGPEFELHYTAVDSEVGFSAVLHVIPKQKFDGAAFIAEVMQRLRISPNRTYADGVAAGHYPPLQCALVSEMSRTGSKKVHFIKK